MMDLALLLCKPVVWKEWALSECRPSIALLPWRPSKWALAETVCWAVLAVVPIVSRQSQTQDLWGERVCGEGGVGKARAGRDLAHPHLHPKYRSHSEAQREPAHPVAGDGEQVCSLPHAIAYPPCVQPTAGALGVVHIERYKDEAPDPLDCTLLWRK